MKPLAFALFLPLLSGCHLADYERRYGFAVEDETGQRAEISVTLIPPESSK